MLWSYNSNHSALIDNLITKVDPHRTLSRWPERPTYSCATPALAGERLLRRRLQAAAAVGVVLQLNGTVVVVLDTRTLVNVERSRISLS